LTLSEAWEIAIAHFQSNRLLEAEAHCQSMLQQSPNSPHVLQLLGGIADRQQHFDRAIAYYQKALELDPNFAAAHYNLGTTLDKRGERENAIACYETAIALAPTFPEAHYSLGSALQHQGKLDEAIAHYQRAIALKSDCIEAYINLGTVLRRQGKLDEAIAHYQRAIQLQPDAPNSYTNLGNTLYQQGKLAAAIACHEKAIALQPDLAQAHYNLSQVLLLSGDLQRGFKEYEWRQEKPDFAAYQPFQPRRWNGTNLAGKTIVLYAEQGLGDTIQMVRYLPQVRSQGAGCILVQCPPALLNLLATCPEIDRLIPLGEPLPAFDVCASLMSLPHLFQTTVETIPDRSPYLSPRAPSPFQPNPHTFNIGIVWAGNPSHPNNQRRSTALSHFLPLRDVPRTTLYSLQKDSSDRLEGTGIVDLSDRLHDLTDTAAIIAQLDLVITVDTAVAHLTGALGKPVWILLPFVPDWRWLQEREDSPWYPTARLFRQPQRGDWAAVFDRVKLALSERIARDRPQSPTLLALTWTPNELTGWGVYGLNLTLQLCQHPNYEPILLSQSKTLDCLHPLRRSRLQAVGEKSQPWQQLERPIRHPFPVMHALGNNFAGSAKMAGISGTPNIGVIFSEDTHLTPEAIDRAQQYDAIVAGSTWNAEILQAYGLPPIYTVHQGIDPTVFHPAPPSREFSDRFVIFSGGKLEYRKGQDIVIAAFRAFHKRHPEALLVTAWHNFWHDYLSGLETMGHVRGMPQIGEDRSLHISQWLADNGIPPTAAIDVGVVPNPLLAQILRTANVAVFTNRAEGGTNLVAMECLACGVPTILSANTGHLDLIAGHCCYPLTMQRSVKSVPPFVGVKRWGESDVDEVVAVLEHVYQHRSEARERGQTAAQWMQNWTWEKQIEKLVGILDLDL
jgi:tetratricopeptide (TPR) repeat protein/glycosyltransferase involved in cell wall biosynthesis